MKADLHVHSYYSDGTCSPQEILRLARQKKITDLGIVDHDSFAGLDEFKRLFDPSPINLIEGIEISAYDFKRRRKVHILGYNIVNRTYVEQLCRPLLKRRHQNTLAQLEKIRQAGYQIDEDHVLHYARHSGTAYKQHIMDALIAAGYEQTVYGPLYTRLFKNGGVAQMDIKYVDAHDAVAAIKLGGGMAVVAHPGQLNSYEIIGELVEEGLDGIEKYHPDHTKKDEAKVQQLMDLYGMESFGGSDFHGGHGPDHFGTCVITNVREFSDRLYQSPVESTILFN